MNHAVVWLVGITAFVVCFVLVFPHAAALVARNFQPYWFLGKSGSDAQQVLRLRVVSTFLDGVASGLKGVYPLPFSIENELSSFEKPFWVEGMCTGLTLARWVVPWRARSSLTAFLNQHERYRFLLVLGAGFARGLESYWRGTPRSDELTGDPRLSALFHDGYGFQQIIFNYLRNPSILRSGLNLPIEWQPGFFQGAGRALWFLTVDIDDFYEAVGDLSLINRNECAVGYGIASGFAGGTRLSQTQWNPSILASPDHEALRLGLVIGLFARFFTDPHFTKSFLQQQNANPLLHIVTDASELYEAMWSAGFDYQAWRDVLRNRLGRETIAEAFRHIERLQVA